MHFGVMLDILTMRTYSELITLQTFEERFEYLSIPGVVGESTFGIDRWIYQRFLHTELWKRVRREVMIRDAGCDLGIPGLEIMGQIHIHHMNPITKEKLLLHPELVLDPEFLICTSDFTHRAIHYGEKPKSPLYFVERKPFDTVPWKNL